MKRKRGTGSLRCIAWLGLLHLVRKSARRDQTVSLGDNVFHLRPVNLWKVKPQPKPAPRSNILGNKKAFGRHTR